MARRRKRPIEPLTPEEVGALIQAASNRGPAGIRNRALIAVLYFAGLRLAEALALEPRDIDLKGGEINVRRGKGGKQRLAGLNAEAQAHLSRWMDTRRKLGISGRRPVFVTFSRVNGKRRIRPISSRYVQTMLKRLAGRAGIAKRVHPHGLRHSHSVHLLRRGVSLPAIQRQLGHSSLATTGNYLEGIGAGEHVEAIRDLDW